MEGYDIIGDIHGYATLLKQLLSDMGYKRFDGIWRHPERKVIFVGDFVNRGPEIRETILLVRAMVESGSALAILGNHEYSSILYHIKDDNGTFMSRHIAGNRSQIQKTLTVFKNLDDEWQDHLKWMRTLPFFLDLGEIRVAHAYWNDDEIARLEAYLPKGRLKKKFLREMHEKRPDMAGIVYKLLKGLEYKTPKDLIIKCSKGLSRKVFTLNWWTNPENKTFRQLYFGSKFILPDYTFPVELAPSYEPYGPGQPIVFFGHYCLANGAEIVQQNICCIDSCVDTTGKLTAYRWSGEKQLKRENLVVAG
ncbi:MAG TPA: metallophosphoesterase [Prolixibacteraceae bacterium]|nr:metallophosphoesterase [Prolixibacteraceae bacterium]